jgi:hypothetical protein
MDGDEKPRYFGIRTTWSFLVFFFQDGLSVLAEPSKVLVLNSLVAIHCLVHGKKVA